MQTETYLDGITMNQNEKVYLISLIRGKYDHFVEIHNVTDDVRQRTTFGTLNPARSYLRDIVKGYAKILEFV